MFGRFYKLHFLLAAFIAFLSPHYVLPQLSSFDPTGQVYAAPTFALPVPATVTVSASRLHPAWVFESAKHHVDQAIAGNYCLAAAVQTSRGGPEFGVTCRPISYKFRSN